MRKLAIRIENLDRSSRTSSYENDLSREVRDVRVRVKLGCYHDERRLGTEEKLKSPEFDGFLMNCNIEELNEKVEIVQTYTLNAMNITQRCAVEFKCRLSLDLFRLRAGLIVRPGLMWLVCTKADGIEIRPLLED